MNVYRPPAVRRPVRIVVREKAGPGAKWPLRAGWSLTGILAALVVLAFCFGEKNIEGLSAVAALAVFPMLMLAGYVYFPALLVLSIVAMCRGAVGRGLLLLFGAPLALIFLFTGGVAVYERWSRHSHREEAAAETDTALDTRSAAPSPDSGAKMLPPLNDPVYLTNTAGKEIRARVDRLEGDTVYLTMDGKPYQIKMDTLTPGSQAKVRASATRD